MPSEYYPHIYDNYLSDSSIQLNETGFTSLSSGSSYSQLNSTESLVDTSSEAYSSEVYTSSCDSNGRNTYFNQDITSNLTTVQEHANRMQDQGLGCEFLLDITARFPNVSSFIGHVFFPLFSKIWTDFQNNLLLASDPNNIFQIFLWFNSVIPEIQRVLGDILNSSLKNEDLGSQSKDMFSAFKILEDQIKKAHQTIQTIEEGPILLTQDPAPTAWQYIEDNSPDGMVNVLEYPAQTYQPTSYNHSRNEIQYDFGVKYPPNGIDYYNIQNLNLILAANNTEYPATALDPSPTESCVTTPAALYIPNISPNEIGETLVTKTVATYQPIEDYSGRYIQANNNVNAPLPHVHPSWLELSSSWSVPVTPSAEINNVKYMSVPTSPTWKKQSFFSQVSIQDDIDSISCTIFPTSNDGSMVQSQESSGIPFTFNQSNSSVSNHSSDELFKDTEEESYIPSTVEESDDEYVLDEVIEEEREPLEERRQSKRTKKTRLSHYTETKSDLSSSLAANTERKRATRAILKNSATNKGRAYTRRTATSYDSQTTHYLKSVFFDIYSQRDKLTKDQRRQVQKTTGLKPRNITYWFSNHKRRFHYALIKFKEARRQKKDIKTYDDFVNWRLSQGLPEEVNPSECDSA